MANVRLNPIMEQVRGQVGDLVFKHYGDKVFVSRKGNWEGIVPSMAQATNRRRFQQAVWYGKEVVADPDKKLLYQTAASARGKSVFNVAMADYLNAPTVGEVDLSNYAGTAGDPITFRARDNFGVVCAQVSIAKTDGTVIESGDAGETSPDSGVWSYTATQTLPSGTHVRITATARDHPGGLGSSQAEIDVRK